MLKVYRYHHPQDRLAYFDQMDLDRSSWVVSDLKSKGDFQNRLLEKCPGFEDEQILRASELWRLLLRRARPDLRIVSRDFLLSWLQSFIEKVEQSQSLVDAAINSRSTSSYLKTMDLLAPVFSHPMGSEKLAEFFNEDPVASARWKDYATLAFSLWQVILKNNMILSSWIPAILRIDDLHLFWGRDLWVDLGIDLRQVEIELVQKLSEQINVHLFVPSLGNNGAYSFLRAPAQALWDSARDKTELKPQNLGASLPIAPVQFVLKKFSGPLAQAKETVAKVREWLELGCAADQIAIVVPDIESEWPLLEILFAAENVKVQKDSVARLHSLPQVSTWLSRLRLMMGQTQYSDIEQAFTAEEMELRFEKFQSLFRQVLDQEDLLNEKELYQKFFSRRFENKDLVAKDFLITAVGAWRDLVSLETLEMIVKDFLAAGPLEILMGPSGWLQVLESLVGKKEVRIQAGEVGGVALLNLSSADSGNYRYRIFLNLSEAHFKKPSSALVSGADLSKLGYSYGFFLDHPEQNTLNFELEWALQSPSQEDHLYYPASGLSGAVEAPHPVWLEKGGAGTVAIPGPTVWDSDQSKEFPDEVIVESWPTPTAIRFSASSIQSYRQCAFAWGAERRLKLMDFPDRDLEMDPMERGSLTHRLFEIILESTNGLDSWTDPILLEVLEKIRLEAHLEHRRGWQWEADQRRYLKIAKKFIEAERDWREKNPGAKIVGLEKEFEFYFVPESQSFSKDPQVGAVLIKGAIDRIDQLQDGALVVVDYKRTFDPKFSIQNWISKNFLQLGFYAWAVSEGLVPGIPSGPVVGAEILVYQKMERRGGFHLREAWPEGLDLEKLGKVYAELRVCITQELLKCLSGHIKAHPFGDDLNICKRCNWKGLCRATILKS